MNQWWHYYARQACAMTQKASDFSSAKKWIIYYYYLIKSITELGGLWVLSESLIGPKGLNRCSHKHAAYLTGSSAIGWEFELEF